jgi:hypothetical protein
MGDEKKRQAWNVHTLKEYVDALFLVKDKALDLATNALNERLNLLNEFRAQQSDESKKYLTRNEYDRDHQALIEKVDALSRQVYIIMGGMSLVYILFYFLGKH